MQPYGKRSGLCFSIRACWPITQRGWASSYHRFLVEVCLRPDHSAESNIVDLDPFGSKCAAMIPVISLTGSLTGSVF